MSIECITVWCHWCDREVHDGDSVRIIRRDGIEDSTVYHLKCAEEVIRYVFTV
jgi:hypothetical protein